MKRILTLALTLALALSIVPAVPANAAADFAPVTGMEMTQILRAGINIGNTLDARATWLPNHDTLESETRWGQPYITRDLLKAYAAKGFNVVRVPTSWMNHMDESYNIDKAWLDRVQQVVDWALAENLYVILNSHHDDFEWEFSRPQTDPDYAVLKPKLLALWRQVADRFKDYPHTLLFEVMNEPNGEGWNVGKEVSEVTNKLNADALALIRRSGGYNDKRCVLLPSAGGNTDSALKWYKHPENDPYAILEVHDYAPYDFTLKPANEAGYTKTFKDDGYFARRFAELNETFIQKGIPVFMDETGVYPDKPLAERMKWLKAYMTEAAKYGIPVVLWDCGDYIDKNTNKWTDEKFIDTMLEYLGAGYKDEIVTRADFCRAAVSFLRGEGYDLTKLTPKRFTDTTDKELGLAAALGLTNGADAAGTIFAPDRVLTRGEAEAFLTRTLRVLRPGASLPAGVMPVGKERFSREDCVLMFARLRVA